VESDLRFDAMSLKQLDFCPPDLDKFPCLRLAYQAVAEGGAKTVALNAADEIAVAAFLEGKIPFLGIASTIEEVLTVTLARHAESIEEVLAQDIEARRTAAQVVTKMSAKRPTVTA
jgi:1-deoxy-D-xylulose-5-phosphate reductoisomerase